MVVKNIFKNVEYPNDRKSIEHIIKEYDKVLGFKLYGKPVEKKLMFIIYIFIIMINIYILKCSWLPSGIKVLYTILPAISIVYDIILRIKIKNRHNKDTKLLFKALISFLAVIWCFIYIGVMFYETFLFDKWTYKEHLISFGVLVIASALIFIKVRIGLPKKFIKKYQYNNNKFFTVDSVAVAIIQLLICIVYFRKPYMLLLIITYIFVPVYLGAITYMFFEYQQYDKIQELKKQINYKHLNK